MSKSNFATDGASYKAMDSKELLGAVLLNLSKAFDLGDHSLLLSKINMYHIDNIEEYLPAAVGILPTPSNTAMLYQWSLSDTLPITRGVPHGSILGPVDVLFLLYINDIARPISNCNADIYADDTTIYE